MRTRKLTLKLGAAALTLATLPLAVNQAFAAEYWLRAGTTTVDMPDPSGTGTISVLMWGYAKCTDAFAACTDPIAVPGPALSVAPPATAGDPTPLTVHLRNDLSVPTSLVINGLIKPMTPVFTTDAKARRRVQSFDAEATPGNIADYIWPNVKPGTYLYQSGTQPQVQVQMGLYGAMTRNEADPVPATSTDPATPGQAYSGTGYTFNNEARLLYSEIDPKLHAAVAGGTYGPCPVASPDCDNTKSTFEYAPKYFLVNGQPYPIGAPVIAPDGTAGTTLLRFLNAGLTTHVPMILGKHWDVIAEDGKPYTYRRTQYTALLPAAKTLDVLVRPQASDVSYAIMDRRLSLSNNGLSDGGMLAFLTLSQLPGSGTGGGTGGGGGTGAPAPVAVDDIYIDFVKGVTINIAARGVLVNDIDANAGQNITAVPVTNGTTSAGGTYTLRANGSFSYTPPPLAANAESDSFTYKAKDPRGTQSAAATVALTLTTPSTPVLSMLDAFERADSNTGLGTTWSQTASTGSFPDVRLVGNQAKAVGAALGGLAIWNQTRFAETQGAGFTSTGSLENSALVLKAAGGTNLAGPANYIRVRCESANGGQVVVHTMMGGGGIETFVQQAAFPAAGCNANGSLSAKVDAKGLVTTFLGSSFVGGVQLPDVAAWKGTGRIGIQLQTPNATIDNFSGGSL